MIHHVAPADSRLLGSDYSSEWKTLSAALADLRQGDKIRLAEGVYTEELSILVPDVEVVALGAAVFDGGSGRLTGWTPSGMGPDIWQKQVSFTALSLFQDSFEGDDEFGAAIGRDAHAWDRGRSNEYDSNPGLKMGDGPSQWIQVGNMLYLRTVDRKSPDLHNIRACVQRRALVANGQANVVFDGITVRHFYSGTYIEGCPGAVVRNCNFRYLGYGIEVHRSDNAVIEGCQVFGGGSGVAHGGQSVYLSNESGLRFEKNGIRWGGHGGIFARSLQRSIVRGNYFGRSSGSLTNFNYASNDNLIEGNVFVFAPWTVESTIHKAAHGAIQLDGDRNRITNNLSYHNGVFIALDWGNGGSASDNVIEYNTIVTTEMQAIVLNGQDAAGSAKVQRNRIAGNVISGARQLVRFDTPGGGANAYYGNRITGNLLYDGAVHLFDDGERDPAEMQRRRPDIMSGNVFADPQFLDSLLLNFALRPGSPAAGLGSTLTDARPPGGVPVPVPTPVPPPTPTPTPTPEPGTMNITSISPNPAQRGETITFQGPDLGAAYYAILYTGLVPDPGRRLSVQVVSGTQVRVTIPTDAPAVVSGMVWLRDRLGLRSNQVQLNIGAPTPPPQPPPPVPLQVQLSVAVVATGAQVDGRVIDAAPLPPGSTVSVTAHTPDGRSASAVATISTDPGPPPPPPTDDQAFARRVIELTNLQRALAGVDPISGGIDSSAGEVMQVGEGRISWDASENVIPFAPSLGAAPALTEHPALMTAGVLHAQDMAAHNFFSHTGSDGSDPGTRMRRAGYTRLTAWGENIADGQATPELVMAAWMNSAGHRANILNPGFVHIGVGRYLGLTVQCFATGEGGPPVPPPSGELLPIPTIAGNPPPAPD